MPQALVTLPDGKKAKVTFDSPEQLDATIADLTKAHPQAEQRMGEFRDGHVRGPMDAVSEAVGEPALQMATGAAASIAGGVVGIARGAGAGAAALAHGEGFERARGAFTDEATDTIERIQEAMTRQPKTRIGKAASKVVSFPFTLLAKGANKAGEVTAEVTGSPAAGAVVNTALQAAPAAILPAARALRGAPVAPELSATGAPRGAPADVGAGGEVPRGSPPPAEAQPQGATQAPGGPQATAPTPNEARAQAYAGRIGLDWSRLGAGTRKALQTIAQDSTALERLNPEAVKRQAHLEALRKPVPATRGQLERDPVQLRREAIASNTAEGQPIRDIDIAANRDLQANLEVLRGRAGGLKGGMHEGVTEAGEADPTSIRRPTKQPTQVGESAQGAFREKAKWSKKGYQALYKAARETEPDAAVPLAPVTALLTENPEIQHLGWVQGWLNKAARAKAPAGGEPVAMTEAKLAELHDLRSTANDIARTGGKEGYYAGQVVKAIDETMQAAPEGAAAWKRANDAFRRHQAEFKDQGIVGKLVSQKKGGADRALALEKTWGTLSKGSLEALRQAKTSLMTGGTSATRMAGRKAWRDIRAETVNRILEDARNVTGADEMERNILTETALRRSINQIPRENLEELIGKANTRELMNILRARRITTRSPVGGRTTQSGTVPNALVLFEKVLKHIPGGGIAVGAKNALRDLADRGAAARHVGEATVSPLEQAARDVEKASRRRASRAALETLERGSQAIPPGGTPPQPLSIGEALKRPTP